MRILHVITSTNPAHGGPVEVAVRFGEAHARLGHHSEIVCVDAPDAPWLSGLSLPVHPLGPGTRKYSYSARIVPWLRDNRDRFDAVVLHGVWDYSTFGGWRGLKGGNTPYVIYPHGMLDPWFRKTYPLKHAAKQIYWLAASGRVMRDAAAVLFTNEEERLLAQGCFFGYPYREKVVAFGTADVAGDPDEQMVAFRRTVPALDGRRFLLFLSRIHPKKGCDLLIKAFARHAAANPDVDLVIAGPDQTGWQKELSAQAESLGLGGRIHWPGMLRGDVKWGSFRAAEAFILPSHQENFGIVVAEAMACGTPVLITDKVNIWREVEASGGGLVAPDTEAGIDRLLANYFSLTPDQRAEMGKRARSGFEREFEIGAAARDLIRTLEFVTDGLHKAQAAKAQ